MEPFHFDAQHYYQTLLAGARDTFLALQRRYASEHIYNYVLCLSGEFDRVEPGVNTEDKLTQTAQQILAALRQRGMDEDLETVRRALRYDIPEDNHRGSGRANHALAVANTLLAEFGGRWTALVDSNAVTIHTDDDGSEMMVTPLDDTLDVIQDIHRRVLRVLDEEGLFGVGAARNSVVVDICWFEGGTPDNLPYALGHLKDPPPPLNPPQVQADYITALVEGHAISGRWFDHRRGRHGP